MAATPETIERARADLERERDPAAARERRRVRARILLDDPTWAALPGQPSHDCSGFTEGDWAELEHRQQQACESVEAEEAHWAGRFRESAAHWTATEHWDHT